MSVERARAEIGRAFPELAAAEVAFLGAGDDSDAYLVGGEWVFRLPKREAVAQALARELALLPRLAERVPLATPQFQCVGRLSDSGLLFAGYRLIRGEPLTAELFGSLACADQERALATLAEFLRAVHEFPIGEAVAAGVERLSTRDWVADCWSGGRGRVLPLLRPPERAALAGLIEGFLADPANFTYTPCLLYADFAPEHVLFDGATRRITGIIDWGDLSIGDPDFDLMYLRQDYGETFIGRLLDHYPHPDPARLFEKLRVFDACDHVNTVAAAEPGPAGDEAIGDSITALGELLKLG